jgi:hypothetical protein
MQGLAVKTKGVRQSLRSARCVLFLAAFSFLPLSPALLGQRVLLPADLLMVMQPFKAHARELGFRRVSNPILDAVQQFWPWRKYAGEQLRSGVIPLWNPYILCGTPFVANNQSAVFYPETWLFAWLKPELAFSWAAALYLFASGAFMFFFLRSLRLRRRAALLGSVAWTYNGFVVGWMCLPSFRSVPGWLPLALGAYEYACHRSAPQRWSWAALAAFALALQFLAGNLHISFYALLVFALYAVWSALRAARQGRCAAYPLAIALLVTLGGVALAAIQLLPTFEFAGRSSRRSIDYTTILGYRLPWPHVLTLLVPDLLGNPVDYNHWGCFLGQQYRAYCETSSYVGAFTLILGLFALWRSSARAVYFWAAVVVVAFALALGSPLNLLFYHFVPGFKQLQGINRAIVMASFALSVLAAFGADGLVRGAGDLGRRDRDLRTLIWCGVVVLLIGIGGTCWAWIASARYETPSVPLGVYTWLQFLRFAAVVVVCGLLAILFVRTASRICATALLLVLAADVAYFAVHFVPVVPIKYCHPPSKIIELLQREQLRADGEGLAFRILSIGDDQITGRLPPNVPMLFSLHDVQGSDSITSGRYITLLNKLCDDRFGPPQPAWDHPAMSILGVGAVVGRVNLFGQKRVDPVLTEGSCEMYMLRIPYRRAFIAERVRAVTDDAEALRLVTAREQDASHWAPVLAAAYLDRLPVRPIPSHDTPTHGPPPQGGWWVVGAPGAFTRQVLTHARGPNMTRLTAIQPSCAAQSSSSGASRSTRAAFLPGDFVVVHDTFYPGWRAYANGHSLHILPIDYCFRGIPVAARRPVKHIDLVYEPTSFKFGGFISMVALAAVTALFIVGAFGHLRRYD